MAAVGGEGSFRFIVLGIVDDDMTGIGTVLAL